ncbi:hypothetical protein P5V15_013351 [Pogonomyrmex californicus]
MFEGSLEESLQCVSSVSASEILKYLCILPVDSYALYETLLENLKNEKKYEHTAILKDYMKHNEEAIALLCEGKFWKQAIRIAFNTQRLDLNGLILDYTYRMVIVIKLLVINCIEHLRKETTQLYTCSQFYINDITCYHWPSIRFPFACMCLQVDLGYLIRLLYKIIVPMIIFQVFNYLIAMTIKSWCHMLDGCRCNPTCQSIEIYFTFYTRNKIQFVCVSSFVTSRFIIKTIYSRNFTEVVNKKLLTRSFRKYCN